MTDDLDLIRRLIIRIGDDPDRGGLKDTPKRVLKALDHLYSGYKVPESEVKKMLTSFEDGAEDCDQMIVQRNVPCWSNCEHHMLPFFGVMHLGYIPKKRVIGLSKFTRLLEIYARRLQVQERLTNQIASALFTHGEVEGCAIVFQCRHSCMECRGVEVAGVETDTIALRGIFQKDASAKAEFLARINVR